MRLKASAIMLLPSGYAISASETELTFAAKLARRLMLGQTTLEAEFPGYRFGKTDWLREQGLR